jgi:phosphoglycolate phosphatase-like HAD superfamily hydrolase
MTLVIFDLDGTLADCSHRLHWILPQPPIDPIIGKKVKRRFDKFEQDIPNDIPIQSVVNIYKRFIADPDVIVVLLSGRNESARDDTTKWLTKWNLDGYAQLYMKASGGSYVPDTEQKLKLANQIEKDWGQSIDMVFEDRARVVEMWKKRGTFVLNVDQALANSLKAAARGISKEKVTCPYCGETGNDTISL